jgi:phosphoglycerol transferase MdoB-like AlkP superfamily enzyme
LELNDYAPIYLNELLYMDWVITSIVDQLDESGLLDRTLVIITNDHGEMLGGKDSHVGHGWAFTPELANTPLIVMDPQKPGYRLNYAIGSQVDFLPTVLDQLNIPLPSGELYQGRSLYASDHQDDRRIYLNTCQQFGILQNNQISVGDRESETAAGFRTSSFTFLNEGAKTLFRESTTTDNRSVSVRAFDKFQENLLRNYSVYCQSVCKDNALSQGKFPEKTSTTAHASR